MCVWDGNSAVVGLEPGLSECNEWRPLLGRDDSDGKWEACGAELVGDVT